MEPVDIVALTRALVDIDSTTGREGAAGRWLAGYLRGRGYTVVEQPVDDSRFHVIATGRDLPHDVSPAIVFSTPIDCHASFFTSRDGADRVYGRGACDA